MFKFELKLNKTEPNQKKAESKLNKAEAEPKLYKTET